MSAGQKQTKAKTIADELKDILDFWDQESKIKGKKPEEFKKDLESNDEVELPSVPDDCDDPKETDDENKTEDQNYKESNPGQRRKNRLREKINLREAYLRRKAEQNESEESNPEDKIPGEETGKPTTTKEVSDETSLSFQIGILDPTTEIDGPLEDQPFNESCSLCKINMDKINANVVYKDKFFTVILAPNGLCQGHLMIFPTGHFPQYMSIPATYHKVLHRLLPKLVLGYKKVT